MSAEKNIGTQINLFVNAMAQYVASLQQTDTAISNRVEAIETGAYSLPKILLDGYEIDTTTAGKITIKKGDNTETLVYVPKSEDFNKATLTVKENMVYKYTGNAGLSTLALTLPNSTLESRVYFKISTDEFNLTLTGVSGTILLNEEQDDLEWDAGGWYCLSILDGYVSISHIYPWTNN